MPDLERTLGRVLYLGILVSTSLLAIGLAIGIALPGYRTTNAALQVGLLVLMVTPALRVVVSFVDYLQRRDYLFAFLTGTVLLVLLGSLVAAVLD